MHYPHEREERKQLFSTLVDNAQQDLLFVSYARVILGSLFVTIALGISVFYGTHATISPALWLTFWSISLGCICLLLFALPLLMPRQKGRKLYGIKREFVIKNMFPSILTGLAVFWVIGLSHLGLSYAAALLGIFFAHTLHSLHTFSMPSIKNHSIITAILSMTLLVVLSRHNTFPLAQHHTANLILVITIGLPSIAVGGWHLVLKK